MIAMQIDSKQAARRHRSIETGERPAFAPLAPGFQLQSVAGLDAGCLEKFRSIVRRLPLVDGVSVTPDPHRSGFYDLEFGEGTYFFYVYPSRRRVMLLAAWLSDREVS